MRFHLCELRKDTRSRPPSPLASEANRPSYSCQLNERASPQGRMLLSDGTGKGTWGGGLYSPHVEATATATSAATDRNVRPTHVRYLPVPILRLTQIVTAAKLK
jgi:hypothetical protein